MFVFSTASWVSIDILAPLLKRQSRKDDNSDKRKIPNQACTE